MATSLKMRAPEVVAVLRTKRQAMAGMVRQLLLDADRLRIGSRPVPLHRHSNDQLRHEVELLQQVLALLTQHGEQPNWVKREQREQQELKRFELMCGEGE